jgi:Xaa-Pro aminopeptidase
MESPPFRERLVRFEQDLEEHGLAAAIVMERRNLLYLTGTAQPCNLLVVPGRAPTLFARRVVDWVRHEAAVDRVIEGASLKAVRDELTSLGVLFGSLGLELDVIPALLFLKASEVFADFQIRDCAPALLEQRFVKDEWEVERLRESCRMFEALHETVLAELRPGVDELSLSAAIVRALRLAGHEGVVFYRRWDAWLQPEGIVASGDAAARISGHAMTVTGVGLSAALPWGASTRVIEPGDTVVVDLGLNKHGYHGDMSRTYVAGEANDTILDMAAAVRSCQDAAIAAIHPGARASDVYEAARSAMAGTRWEACFQGYGAERGEYIGHGVGLELDELPVLSPRDSTLLAKHMALAIEPKVITPDAGAVQMEDTVIVTDDGCEVIGTVPRQLFEVTP